MKIRQNAVYSNTFNAGSKLCSMKVNSMQLQQNAVYFLNILVESSLNRKNRTSSCNERSCSPSAILLNPSLAQNGCR